MDRKIKNIAELSRLVKKARQNGRKVVFTNGCFDILHIGHIRYLKKARSMGDMLVVGLNSDGSVRRIKGKARPINTQKDRAEILSALSFVDYITIFDDDTPERLIKGLSPDILVKGADWKSGDIVGSAFVRSYGGEVKRIKFVAGYSTTATINKACLHGKS